jgi:hypothetical protein
MIICFSLNGRNVTNSNHNIFENLMIGFLSIFFAMIAGHYTHVISHRYNYTQIYVNICQSNNKIFRLLPKCIHYIILKLLWFSDFHDIIHHDSNINHTFLNLLIEFCLNIYSQSIGWILFFKCIGFTKLNNAIILSWGLFYATTHIINYNIIHPDTHVQHHLNKYINYSYDFINIILGIKQDDEIENMNHASINVICTMLFILAIYSC